MPTSFLRTAPEPWRGYARGPRPALTIGLLVLGGALLLRHLRTVDWQAMHEVIAAMPREALIVAGLLAVASYSTYCSFDLLGRRATGHALAPRRTLAIAFVVHACGLNLGPAGAGMRFRLYAQHGLPLRTIAALWLFTVTTNWLGFSLVGGIAFATRWIALPPGWGPGGPALQALGFALLAVVATYVGACAFGHRRSLVVRGVAFRMPPLHVALLQCTLAAVNWLLLAGIVWVLLRQRAPYESVLGALMASALALAVVDVPAGLGVTETVFLGLLGGVVPSHEILGALLAYRGIYFVGPLFLAGAVYAALEWDARAGRRRTGAPVRPRPRSRGARSPPRAPDAPRPRPRRSS
ncbi:MAG TPA: YbhN family protein [Albitalea sp.]